jgi:hypothetical protein
MSDVNSTAILEKLIYNRENPIDWIRNSVKIQHPAHGIIPFDLYPFQEKLIKLFLLKHFIITLKSRQIGMSTLVQSICLWSALHYSNYNILIFSAGQRNASSFLDKIRKMYEYLPEDEWKLKLDVDNRQSLIFSNGSKIVAVPATRSASLGESINLLIIDEAAFIENVELVYQAGYPTLSRAFNSMKGKPFGIIIISTPNGISGTGQWYYEMYEGALRKDNKYIPVKIHWSAVPEYDKNWYIDQCSQLNWNYRSIAAELELSFVSSGNTYIPGPILDAIETVDPIAKDLEDHLWIWELEDKEQSYVMGVDVAYGDRKDSSTIQVIKASTLEQVAEYDSNLIKPDDFADVVIKISKMYNNALINIERNAVGKVLIDKIVDRTGGIGVNFYRDVNKNELDGNLNNRDLFKSMIGTLVTGQSRDVILANMYNIILDKYTEALNTLISEDEEKASARIKFEAIMSGRMKDIVKKRGIIKSERLHHQLLGFVVDDHGRPEGVKDDLVFAWSHSLYCWTKSKAFLLRDMAKILSNTVGLEDAQRAKVEIIEFMKDRSKSKIWKDLSIEELQEILDEENVQNSKIKIEDNKEKKDSPVANIYKAFYR